MACFVTGLVLLIADYLWLWRAVTWGENPLVYHAGHSQEHFWAFLIFSSVAHITVAVGTTLLILRRRD